MSHNINLYAQISNVPNQNGKNKLSSDGLGNLVFYNSKLQTIAINCINVLLIFNFTTKLELERSSQYH